MHACAPLCPFPIWGFMNSKLRLTDETKLLCAELTPDDGIDPRKYFSRKSKTSSNRKTYQLCKEIELTLNLTLAGELADPALSSLVIAKVEPIPESGDFLVIFEWRQNTRDFQFEEVMFSIKKASGFLRSEVAKSINRKRVPQLSYRLLNPEEVKL